ncbi:MAG: hypothetical protein U5K79_02050 [Cyclobacteriaceae bacterium]|nr:hypothetical protein [Cyclobacteriaceae bacterium]
METSVIANVTETSATGGGNVVNDGGGTIESRGVVWNTTPNPSIQSKIRNDL